MVKIIENKKKKIFYVVSIQTGKLLAECLSFQEALKVKHKTKKDYLFI